MRTLTKACILAGLTALPAVQAYAFTAMSNNVTVTFDDLDNQLFGNATVSGSGNTTTITFFPDQFAVQSANGEGVVSIFDILNITIDAKPGFEITDLTLAETGDYQLSADFGSSGNAPQVNARGLWAITSNTKIDTNGNGDLPAGFNFRKGNLFDTGTLTGQTNSSAWSISETVDLSSVTGWGTDTSVTATLENHISAWTFDSGELANIAKKFGGVTIDVTTAPTVVPVPAAVWLFGSGLIGLVAIARRREQY